MSSLPIENMKTFCEKHKLGENALEELQELFDNTMVHVARCLMSRAPSENKTKKVPAPKKKKPERTKCIAVAKKSGNPCRNYALDDSEYCKTHKPKEMEDTSSVDDSSVVAVVGDEVSNDVCNGMTKGKPCKQKPSNAQEEDSKFKYCYRHKADWKDFEGEDAIPKELPPNSVPKEESQEQVVSEQEEVVSEQEEVVSEQEEVVSEQEEVVSEQEEVVSEPEEVVSEQEEVVSEQEEVVSEPEEVVSEQEEVVSEQEEVVSSTTTKEEDSDSEDLFGTDDDSSSESDPGYDNDNGLTEEEEIERIANKMTVEQYKKASSIANEVEKKKKNELSKKDFKKWKDDVVKLDDSAMGEAKKKVKKTKSRPPKMRPVEKKKVEKKNYSFVKKRKEKNLRNKQKEKERLEKMMNYEGEE